MDFRTRICHCKLSPAVGLILFVSALAMVIAVPPTMHGQTAGEGTISGTVTDGTGAAIPNAQVTAINIATNVATVRTSSSSGLFTVAPLPPGAYSLQVTASGFKALRRDDLTVNALGVLDIDVVLTVGQETQTVVVTTAPPVLDTSTATLGLVMENETSCQPAATDEQRPTRPNGVWSSDSRRAGREPPAGHRRYRKLPGSALPGWHAGRND